MGAALLVIVVVRAAWLCDDAYITLRTADNFVHGYGLRWNVGERVQSFTHPLWLALIIPVYAAVGSGRESLFLLSLSMLLGVTALLFHAGRPRPGLLGLLLVALGCSKSFVEYSTSGLENGLMHVLVGAAVLGEGRAARLLLVSSFVVLTRPDAILLILPLLLASLWKERHTWRAGLLFAAALPVIVWECFSLIYYGFPLPNTAYAKLAHGVPRLELVSQGVVYLLDMGRMDPAGSVLLAAGLVIGILRRSWALSLGIVAWTLYLVLIGGDFMSGRLFSPALVVAAFLVVKSAPAIDSRPAWIAAAAMLCVAAVLGPSPAIWGPPAVRGDGRQPYRVTDERAFYYPTTGLLRTGFVDRAFEHPWAQRALHIRDAGRRVCSMKSVGFAGYFAGPRLHIVDEYGLTDPLLARLPAEPDWSPGHFHRMLPEGYLETLERGQNVLKDPEIARYYDALIAVTRGPVRERSRFAQILRVNSVITLRTASYDVLEVHSNLFEAHAGPMELPGQGLRLRLTTPMNVLGVEVAVDSDDQYIVRYERDGRVVATSAVPSHVGRQRLALAHPQLVDAVWLTGRRGDYEYHATLLHPIPVPQAGRD